MVPDTFFVLGTNNDCGSLVTNFEVLQHKERVVSLVMHLFDRFLTMIQEHRRPGDEGPEPREGR